MAAETQRKERQLESALAGSAGVSAGGRGHLARASIFSAARLARLHLARGWRMLLAVGLGMLVAVVLICTVPLYSILIGNVQLQATLNGEEPLARDVELQVPGSPLTADLAEQADAIVRPIGARALVAYTQPAVTRYYSAASVPFTSLNDQPVDVAGSGLRALFLAYDYAQALSHMRLVAGVLPHPPTAGSAAPVDALITSQMAQDLSLHLGDTFAAGQTDASSHTIAARVVGIWEPRQADDPFWNGRDFTAVITPNGTIYPVLLESHAFLSAFAALPSLETREHWIYYTVPARLSTANMGRLRDALGALRGQLANALAALNVGDPLVLSALPQNISDVRQQLTLLSQPLYVVVAQVVGLALLFVAAMAGLLIEGQASAIATLKSRGAGRTQMLASYALLGLLLGGVAAVAGPWLASRFSITLIERLLPPHSLAQAHVTAGFLSALASPAAAAIPAIGGALLGAGAVVVAAARAAQLDVLSYRRGQGRARGSFWRRYFLDLQVAAICVVVYMELSQFGGLGTRETLDGAANSPLLLAAPGLLLLAGSLLLLRLFPYAVAAGLRLVARARGAAGMLAFAQVSRSPSAPTRLALLLALAVGMGLFALTFDASLTHNAADRASYEAGADLRLVEQSAEPGIVDSRIQAQLRALPNVTGVSAAVRDKLFNPASEGGSGVNLLAVDPNTWQQVAGATSWRADYADRSSTNLMTDLSAHQWGAPAADRAGQTQAGDSDHPIWAIVSQAFADTHHLRVGDRFPLVIGVGVNAPTTFRVGAVVTYFPTMYLDASGEGFVVVGLNDYIGAYILATGINSGSNSVVGPNEYWVANAGGAAGHDRLLAAISANNAPLDVNHVVDRLALEDAIAANPIQSGVRGLLLVGAFAAAALAVLGSIVQSVVTARARNVQFAVLRTLGLTNRLLTRVLLGEQLVVYVFGMLGGALLGLVLAAATLPFLQFGDTTVDPTRVGVPPVLLTTSPTGILAFGGALALALAAALAIAGVYAARAGLGQALRIGED